MWRALQAQRAETLFRGEYRYDRTIMMMIVLNAKALKALFFIFCKKAGCKTHVPNLKNLFYNQLFPVLFLFFQGKKSWYIFFFVNALLYSCLYWYWWWWRRCCWI